MRYGVTEDGATIRYLQAPVPGPSSLGHDVVSWCQRLEGVSLLLVFPRAIDHAFNTIFAELMAAHRNARIREDCNDMSESANSGMTLNHEQS